MLITDEHIEFLKTDNGGYTKKTLLCLGIDWPAIRGWKNNIIGTKMGDDLRGFFKESEDKFNLFRAKRNKPVIKKKRAVRKKKDTYPKRREQVLKDLGLNEYATNAGVCLAIHNKTGWPIPGRKNQYPKFITRYSRQLNRASKLPNRKQRSKVTDFYSSKQWKEARYIVLSKSEGRCQLCGASASDGVQIHVDHIKPRSTHPELELDLDNLGTLCSDCNLGKSNYDDYDYRNKF